MNGPLWLLVAAVVFCTALHFSPRDSFRELAFAVLTLTAVLAIPAGYLAGSWG